jgi:hypothetical protein
MDREEEKKSSYEETIEKAKASTQKALQDAMLVFGYLAADPMRVHQKALTGLSVDGLMYAGIVFSAVFALFQALALGRLVFFFAQFFGEPAFSGGANYFKLFFVSLAPVLALFLSFLGTGFVADKKVNSKLALYATGVTLFPIAALFFLSLLLGMGKLLLIFVLVFVCYCVLLTYSALYDLYNLHTRTAFLLTPALLFVGGYITGWLYDLLA